MVTGSGEPISFATTSPFAPSTGGSSVSLGATVILTVHWSRPPAVPENYFAHVWWATAPTGPWDFALGLAGDSDPWTFTIPPQTVAGEIYVYLSADCGIDMGGTATTPAAPGVSFAYQAH